MISLQALWNTLDSGCCGHDSSDDRLKPHHLLRVLLSEQVADADQVVGHYIQHGHSANLAPASGFGYLIKLGNYSIRILALIVYS